MTNKPDGAALTNVLPPVQPGELPDDLHEEALEQVEVDLPDPEEEEFVDAEVDVPPPPEPDYEREARSMGWHPREEYLGPPSKWTDAKTFVERGKNILPILRENNRKLIERAERQSEDIRAMREILNEMRQRASQADQNGYQRALSELKQRQREAASNGDVEAYDKIEEQIAGIKPPSAAPPPPSQGTQVATEITQFVQSNPWYMNDRVLNQAMQAEHVRIAEEQPELTLAENLETAARMVKQRFPQKFGGRIPATNGHDNQPPKPTAPARPRVASVAPPTGGARPAPRPGKGPIDQIEDATERAEARAAYTRMKRHMSDYTEDEYMSVFANPKADILTIRASSKEKK